MKKCPEPGCGKVVKRLDSHMVYAHGAVRGPELHSRALKAEKVEKRKKR